MLWIIRTGEVKSDGITVGSGPNGRSIVEPEIALEAVYRFRSGDAATAWFRWTPELLGQAMVLPGVRRVDQGRFYWYTVAHEMPAQQMASATRPFDLFLHDDTTGQDVVKRFAMPPGVAELSAIEHGEPA
ncbi:hypothetical protein ACFY1P_20140 [Streptomyces sp. NPDC001407]|uniref:hypothetical protein n=1 Tax=Streptomyces sp. NPDC001407 TaxID=3364573 RepID=UPI0036C823BE